MNYKRDLCVCACVYVCVCALMKLHRLEVLDHLFFRLKKFFVVGFLFLLKDMELFTVAKLLWYNILSVTRHTFFKDTNVFFHIIKTRKVSYSFKSRYFVVGFNVWTFLSMKILLLK